MRITDKVEDTCIIAINPSKEDVSETVLLKDSRLMNYSILKPQGENSFIECKTCYITSGTYEHYIRTIRVCCIKTRNQTTKKAYTPYKRCLNN